MDSRTKILSLDAAHDSARLQRQSGRRVRLVTGYFDPVLASHAAALADAARDGAAVFVAVGEPEEPLLGSRARAELVAGLASVAAVVIAGHEQAASAIEADDVIHQEADDTWRTRELIQHVQSRQSGR